MVFPRRHYFCLSLGRGVHILFRSLSVKSHRLASNLRNLDLFANHLPQIVRRIPLEGGGGGGGGGGHRVILTDCYMLTEEVMLHGTIRNDDF